MFGIKRLAQKMIQGVDVVKLVLYKVLTEDFAEKYKEKGEKFYKTLATSIINEIFGCHNPESQKTFSENKKIVAEEIKNLGTKHPELKRPITDALRVFIQANQMLGSSTMKDTEYVVNLFDKAIERGIFIKGGDAPSPEPFLQMMEELIKKYNLK
ncbi:hypothetical protein KKF32_00165 [Patescibacteria group bacterium]|nr:hypothetical protein [Patescibacteria group bacterium]